MIRVKDNSVSLKDLKPQTVYAIMVVRDVLQKFMCETIITSVNDGVHGKNSLHYYGYAVDFRTKNIGSEADDYREEVVAGFVEEVKRCLGNEFDVVMEDLGEDNEHLHVEWDPDWWADEKERMRNG